ncbi:MAG TPA: hypothetical protein VN648_23380 [Candidatus Methylomirabilis sp.]|nr:hypothetical protein [Candidatus Methylomirabilis sp.]
MIRCTVKSAFLNSFTMLLRVKKRQVCPVKGAKVLLREVLWEKHLAQRRQEVGVWDCGNNDTPA